jgi:predicted nucleic acid-binding protein
LIVVDTSAVIAALASLPRDPGLVRRIGEDGDLHAPHLIDVEIQHALRGLVARRGLTDERAEGVRTDFADLALVRYPHHPLADRMWDLRRNLTPYDAAFVALSEALDAALITCDARLAASPGHRARIEVFGVQGARGRGK